MPIIGLSLGRVASGLLGRWVDIVAASLLVGLAVWMFFEDQDADSLSDQSLLMAALGVSIDELVAGVAWGLGTSRIGLLSLALAMQAVVWTVVGMFFGRLFSRWIGEWAERLASIGLAVLGIYVIWHGTA